MRFVGGILALLIFYGLLNGYIGWHAWLVVSLLLELLLGDVMTSAPLLFGLSFSILPLAFILSRLPFVRGRAQHLLQWIGAWYIAVFYFSLLLLPALDGLYWLLHEGTDFSRLQMITGLCALYLLVMIAIIARGSWNARHPIVRQHTLEITGKRHVGASTRSLTVLVASDLHLGHLVGKTHVLKLLELAKQHAPDLILLPGDVVDDDPQAFVDGGMAHVMHEIAKTARCGAFAVLGNHEYYGRQIEAYVRIMETCGVRVLRDEMVLLDDQEFGTFYVIGRKDVTAEQMDVAGRLTVQELVSDADQSLPLIMMDHQPRRFDLAEAAGIDVLLCGHTHRGQFAPNHWITRKIFELDWGYLRKQSMHVLVSSGFGTWGPPMRLASRSEVLLVTLTRI